MASGVEMLGQMSETDALAGPVQGGNMVVKPNEVPVGGAAMLAKAMRGQANKGVGGIYELPSQEPKTPEFMQMAQAGLQERDPMRGMGPRRGLTPFDMANMAGAVEQAGIINFLGEQPEVTAPIRAKSHADAPATELAYITAAEKQMLLDANMHGSLEGNQPNPGPAGIQSLDDFYNYTDSAGKTQVGGGSGQNVFDSGVDSGSSGNNNNNNNAGGYQSSEDFYADQVAQDSSFADNNQNLLGTDTSSTFTGDQEDPTMPIDFKPFADDKKDEEKSLQEKLNDIKGTNNKSLKEFGITTSTMVGDLGSKAKDIISQIWAASFGKIDFSSGDSKKDKDKKKKDAGNFIDKLFSGGAFGTIMDKISKPTEKSFMDNNYKAIMKDKYFDNKGNIKPGMEDDYKRFSNEYSNMMEASGAINPNENILSMEDVIKSGVVGKDTNLQRRLNPTEYFKNNPPKTGQDFKDMAQAQAEGKLAFTKGNTLAIQQGRELLSQDRGGNQNNRPAVMGQTIDNMEVMPGGTVVDEESQTMEYSSPRTGGTETSVPLQRRFRTDPTQDVAQYRTTPRTEADIYKYMTEGTTGEGIGLEPFSEYQRRRRKALGQEELGLFN